MKTAGLLLLIAACGGFGLSRWQQLRRRTTALAQAVRLLAWLEIQLRYTAAPWRVLFTDPALPADCRELPFWEPLLRRMAVEGAPAAWAAALEQTACVRVLTSEDRALLGGFGEQLGATDVEGQRAHCALYRVRLEEQLETARQEQQVRGRVYVTLGFAVGLAMAILLM